MDFNLACWRASEFDPENPKKKFTSGIMKNSQPKIIPEVLKQKKIRGDIVSSANLRNGETEFFPQNMPHISSGLKLQL